MPSVCLQTLSRLIISLHPDAVRAPHLTEAHEAVSTGDRQWVSAPFSHPPPSPPASSASSVQPLALP